MSDETPQLIIEAGRPEKRYWADIWAFRGLFYFLTWRDIKVRYKQTALGVIWAFLRPFLTMIIFTIIFGHVAKMPTVGDTPYPIMVFAALLPWQMFANALSSSSNSMVSSANLISKIYFPRLIIPVGSAVTSLVDFCISFIVLCLLMLYFGFVPDVNIFLLPLFLFLALITALGAGILMSALNVSYRDFQYLIPFVVQMGLYISPVGFASSVVPDKWRLLYSLNPMVGVIDGFRWCILGQSNLYVPGFIASIVISVSLLILGITVFRKTERTFADKI